MRGGKKLLTIAQVRKRRCCRCGRKAEYQWSACATGHHAVCVRCDVKLNKLAMKFMRVKGWKKLYRKYKESKNV